MPNLLAVEVNNDLKIKITSPTSGTLAHVKLNAAVAGNLARALMQYTAQHNRTADMPFRVVCAGQEVKPPPKRATVRTGPIRLRD